jgi:L-seryl-tRNA(Ser) seleniumtransferase
MDVLPETWTLRRKYLESGMLPGPPLQGIGRALKVGKEEIAGLLTALKIYVNKDHAAERREWIRRLAVLQQSLENIPNLRAELSGSENEGFPLLQVSLNEKALGITAFDLINQLLDGDPAIAVGQGRVAQGCITVHPLNLDGDKPTLIADRIRHILSA